MDNTLSAYIGLIAIVVGIVVGLFLIRWGRRLIGYLKGFEIRRKSDG